MTVASIILQRRVPGPRADALLEAVQDTVPETQRTRWNESGHARLVPPTAVDDFRKTLAARFDRIAEDWTEHIAIL
jgi:hypothetical protein